MYYVSLIFKVRSDSVISDSSRPNAAAVFSPTISMIRYNCIPSYITYDTAPYFDLTELLGEETWTEQ